ncbi:hypothetical protein Bca4012_012208 [Brassica carinata]
MCRRTSRYTDSSWCEPLGDLKRLRFCAFSEANIQVEDVTYPGYTDDKTVTKHSLTPTFAAAALFIDNEKMGWCAFSNESWLSTTHQEVLEGDTRCIRERLLLDAIEGERRLFIRSDDLDAAWSLFTPLLKEIEEKKRIPEYYPYGSRGPVGAHYLAAKHKVQWGNISPDQ